MAHKEKETLPAHNREGSLPAETPDYVTGEYVVPVSLIASPVGVLLVENEQEIRRRYAEIEDDLEIQFASKPDALEEQKARLVVAREQEIRKYFRLIGQAAAQIVRYEFQFSAATNADVEEAEAAAALRPEGREVEETVPLRTRPKFKERLAEMTFTISNFPGHEEELRVPSLPPAVAEYVLAHMARRIYFSRSVHDFLF